MTGKKYEFLPPLSLVTGKSIPHFPNQSQTEKRNYYKSKQQTQGGTSKNLAIRQRRLCLKIKPTRNGSKQRQTRHSGVKMAPRSALLSKCTNTWEGLISQGGEESTGACPGQTEYLTSKWKWRPNPAASTAPGVRGGLRHWPEAGIPGRPRQRCLHTLDTFRLRQLMKTPSGNLWTDSSCDGYVYHAG